MKTFTKSTTVLIIFLITFLGGVNFASASTPTIATTNDIETASKTQLENFLANKTANSEPITATSYKSFLPDVSPTFYWWGVETMFGKAETKQIAQLITDHGKEGTTGICAAMTGGAVFLTAACTYVVNFATGDIQNGFIQAAKNNNKALLTTPYLGGVIRWTVVEAPEK